MLAKLAHCFWPDARRLIDSTLDALGRLKEKVTSIKVNGIEAKNAERLWKNLKHTTLALMRNTVLRSLRWSQNNA